MRVQELKVKNLRLFGDVEQSVRFADDKNVTVVLGDNGAGKTTLLFGLSVALSQFYDPFPNVSKKDFSPEDIRNVSNETKADFLHVGVRLRADGIVIPVDLYRRGIPTVDVPPSVLGPIKEHARSLAQRIEEDRQVTMPILAYYGTERGQIKPPERRRDFSKVFPRWASYDDSLEPATNFKRFFTWFERNEDQERREQVERRDFNYRSYVLEAVRSALNGLDHRYTNPRVLVSPLRFAMDDVSDPHNPQEVRIERMSDGYRIMIALVADIAARMAEANPSVGCSGLDDPLQTPGIVMIDEIDLHLHPSWQREVLRQLHSVFPNVQFIVTTHSPNVVIGAMDIAQVVTLHEGTLDDSVDMGQYSRYDVSLLLLSDLFGMSNVRSDRYARLAAEEESLLLNRNLTAEQQERLRALSRELMDYYRR